MTRNKYLAQNYAKWQWLSPEPVCGLLPSVSTGGFKNGIGEIGGTMPSTVRRVPGKQHACYDSDGNLEVIQHGHVSPIQM